VRGRATERETLALLLGRVDYGESDVIVTFLTEELGKVGALVRGGRKSRRRAGGALEPMQTARVTLEDRGGELSTLREARVERPRVALLGNLTALETAGTALRWARHACPPRMPEPEVFAELSLLLDDLDAGAAAGREDALLARFGVRLLEHVGWGLELGQCIVCGKPRPPARAAIVSAARGGVLCVGCAGHAIGAPKGAAEGAVRGALVDAIASHAIESPAEVALALTWVRTALAAHAGYEE
jgi:DNA repair protein RecO (recombination protein O)